MPEQNAGDDHVVEVVGEIPDDVVIAFRAFSQAFQIAARVALVKVRPTGTERYYYIMAIIPSQGAPAVPLAIIPQRTDFKDGVLQMIQEHAILLDRYGAPQPPAKLN